MNTIASDHPIAHCMPVFLLCQFTESTLRLPIPQTMPPQGKHQDQKHRDSETDSDDHGLL
jgi:hypothetical protein